MKSMSVRLSSFNMRMDANRKSEAEQLFDSLGMTLPQAVNVFIAQSLLVGGLPFEVKVPKYKPDVEAALCEADDIASGKIQTRSYRSAEELFEDLDAE